MILTRAGTHPSAKGPANYFTGSVRIDAPFQASEPGRAGGATVTFEPGARTAWHTHPLGQTLIIMAGCGWEQREGGPIEGHVAANLNVGNDRARLVDVLTQLLPFIGYPRTLNGLRMVNESTAP